MLYPSDFTQVLMVWWYFIHVAVENFPSVRKKGFILLGNDKDMRLRHFHPRRGLGVYYING